MFLKKCKSIFAVSNRQKTCAILTLLFASISVWVFGQSEINGQAVVFGSDKFSVKVPSDWKATKSKTSLVLSSPQGDKALHITVYGVPKGKSPFNEIAFSDEKLKTIHNEFYSTPDVGYQVRDTYGSNGLRIINLAAQIKDVMVHLSFGDYNCLSKTCSNETIQLIENTFKIKNNNSEVSFKEIREKYGHN